VRWVNQRAGLNADLVNAAFNAASGDFVGLAQPGVCFEPDMVQRMLLAAADGVDLVYADDLTDVGNDLLEADLRARPAFSWDFFMCRPDLGPIVVIRRKIALPLLRDIDPEAAALDLTLKVVEGQGSVAQIPAVLCRNKGGIEASPLAAPTDSVLATLARHIDRVLPGSIVRSSVRKGEFEVDFPDDHGTVLAIIPTKNRVDLLKACIESIKATTLPCEVVICVVDHESDDPATCAYLRDLSSEVVVLPYTGSFNYARINNFAVRSWREQHGVLPRYLLFANNDIEAIGGGWLERLRSVAGRADVGAVGVTLLYPNDSIQHAGVIVGMHGAADHAHKFTPAWAATGDRTPGYLSSLVSTRNYSAVTAACLMLRSEVFELVGGFDESFAVAFNDTDLCLRVGARGLHVLSDGRILMRHHESATRSLNQQLTHPEDDNRLKSQWTTALYQGADPFYSPLLSYGGKDHRVCRFSSGSVQSRVRPGLALPARSDKPSSLK
jgi:GT2 family glycosyltransferase